VKSSGDIRCGQGCPFRVGLRKTDPKLYESWRVANANSEVSNTVRKGGDHTLSTLKSIRTARGDDAPIYVILDFSREQDTRHSCLGDAKQG
jgi:hypothetical protein